MNLTARQRRIVELYAHGLRAKEIAHQLSMSKTMVDREVERAKTTTGCMSLPQLCVKLYTQQLITVQF